MENVRLRPVEEADVRQLADWIQQPYILKWYEDAEAWLTEIRGRHAEYAWIHHFIVMAGETPIGFGQYYDAYDARELEDWYTVGMPDDRFSIDYFIGEAAYLGKGYGKAIVGLLTERVGKAGGREVIVQPEPENGASCGALLANGYVFDTEKGYYRKTLR